MSGFNKKSGNRLIGLRYRVIRYSLFGVNNHYLMYFQPTVYAYSQAQKRIKKPLIFLLIPHASRLFNCSPYLSHRIVGPSLPRF